LAFTSKLKETGDQPMANKPAGGLGSNKVIHRNAPKAEPKPRAVNPAAVNQLGEALAFRPEPLFVGKGYATPQGPSDNVAAVGVGGGRTVMSSGSQATHGPVVPGSHRPGAGKDILSEFGPDKPGI
jgi:hypothetical protein